MTSFFPWKIIRAITHEIEHVEKSGIYSTICTEHIQHNNDDKTKIQKLLNPEINQNEVFGNNLRNFRFFS